MIIQRELIADTILANAKIITVDKKFSIAQAIAIRDDRIIGVGTSEEIKSFKGNSTECVDIQGKTIIPGFIDGHAHMDREGLKFLYPSLDGKRSITQILEVIKQEVRQKQAGEWVITMPLGDYPFYYGTEQPDFLEEQRWPTRWDLDRIAPENPVYIRGIWFYWRQTFPIVSIANSYALKMAGIDKHTLPPYEGLEIVRDKQTGEPTGVFLEWNQPAAMEFSLMKIVPRFTHEHRVKGLKRSMARYNAVGTTSVYEGHGISSETFRAYRELWEQNEMTVRSYLVRSPAWDAVPEGALDEVLREWAVGASGTGFGDHMLKIGGIWTSIGTPPTNQIRRKACPYTAWAGYGGDQSLPPARGTLYDLMLAAIKADIRPNAIAAGTSLLDTHLDVLEQVHQLIDIHDKRIVLQHLKFVTESHMERIQKLGIVPTVIPGSSLWKAGSTAIQVVAPEIRKTYFPLQRFVEKRIPFVLCTDNSPIEPLHVFWTVVTRRDRVTGEVIVPEQKISRKDALKALTINGAYLTFEENLKGSIEKGKLADLAVLSDDPLTCPEENIRDIQVTMTFLGGKIVYKR